MVDVQVTSTISGSQTCSVRQTLDLKSPVIDVPVSIAQAALGTELDLETLDGIEHLVVPAGVQHGHEFVLRGRGVPRLSNNGRARGRGNLRARLVVSVPGKLSNEEQSLLRRFAELRGEAVTEEGLVSKIKSAFS